MSVSLSAGITMYVCITICRHHHACLYHCVGITMHVCIAVCKHHHTCLYHCLLASPCMSVSLSAGITMHVCITVCRHHHACLYHCLSASPCMSVLLSVSITMHVCFTVYVGISMHVCFTVYTNQASPCLSASLCMWASACMSASLCMWASACISASLCMWASACVCACLVELHDLICPLNPWEHFSALVLLSLNLLWRCLVSNPVPLLDCWDLVRGTGNKKKIWYQLSVSRYSQHYLGLIICLGNHCYPPPNIPPTPITEVTLLPFVKIKFLFITSVSTLAQHSLQNEGHAEKPDFPVSVQCCLHACAPENLSVCHPSVFVLLYLLLLNSWWFGFVSCFKGLFIWSGQWYRWFGQFWARRKHTFASFVVPYRYS